MKAGRISLWLPGALFFFLFLAPAGGLAEPLDRWREENPFTQGFPLRISHLNGIFVAVGESGAIYTSSDGAEWKARSSGTRRALRDSAFGRGLFVAVGEGGEILSSTDGAAWRRQSSGTGHDLHGVGYGEGLFVAVGDGGIILTSPDGLTWSKRDSWTHQRLNQVAYGNGTFVAAGMKGTLLSSTDGSVWTARESGTWGDLNGIAFGKGTFVAAGDAILTSPDGAAWTERAAGIRHRIFGIAYGSGVFAAAADNGAVLTSPDGSRWTVRDSRTHRTLRAVAHGKEAFLAVGERGILLQSDPLPSPRISVSPDSIDFGQISVGNSSFTTLTASNSGSADLVIRQITLSGTDSLDFSTRNDNCTGATLPPSGSCSLQVVFSPRFTGPRSAVLSISSNDPDTPTRTVSLSGSGTDGGLIISTGSTGTSCFFSTSVKGTGLEADLRILRKFRDDFLLKRSWGRALAGLYYRHSPALSQFLAGRDSLRRALAFALVPPLAAAARVLLHTSPAEIAFLLLLLAGGIAAGRRLIRREGAATVRRNSKRVLRVTAIPVRPLAAAGRGCAWD